MILIQCENNIVHAIKALDSLSTLQKINTILFQWFLQFLKFSNFKKFLKSFCDRLTQQQYSLGWDLSYLLAAFNLYTLDSMWGFLNIFKALIVEYFKGIVMDVWIREIKFIVSILNNSKK